MKKILNVLLLFTIVFSFNVVYADAEDLHSERGHITCISFIDTENSPNNIESRACGQANGSKISKKLSVTKFSKEGTIYEFDGWYDEDGNKIDSYYNGDETRIKVSYTYSKEKCQDIKYYLKWKKLSSPILNFIYTDNISTGSGSWTNSNGSTESYTHTFKSPEEKPHYKFLYWELDDSKYYDGDKYTYSFTDKEYNTTETLNAYAVWQPSVIVNLYDGDTLLKTYENFESVSVDYVKEKVGYNFVGWFDDLGNEADTTFYAPDESSKNINYKVVNLYAKYEKKKITIDIVKNWDDNDNERGLRPNSISVNLYEDDKLLQTYTITKDMNWIYQLVLDQYDLDGNEISYTIKEINVDNYISIIDKFNILNKIIPEKIGNVVVNYVDKDTNNLLESITLNGVVGSKYNTSVKDIDNYKYLEVVGSVFGEYSEEDIIVTYYYSKINTQEVIEEVNEEVIEYTEKKDIEEEIINDVVIEPPHTGCEVITFYKVLYVKRKEE